MTKRITQMFFTGLILLAVSGPNALTFSELIRLFDENTIVKDTQIASHPISNDRYSKQLETLMAIRFELLRENRL